MSTAIDRRHVKEGPWHLKPALIGLTVVGLLGLAAGARIYADPYITFQANMNAASKTIERPYTQEAQTITVDMSQPWEIDVVGDSWPYGYREAASQHPTPFSQDIETNNMYYLRTDLTLQNASHFGATTYTMTEQLNDVFAQNENGRQKVVVGGSGGNNVMYAVSEAFPDADSFSRLVDSHSRDDIDTLNQAVDNGATTHEKDMEMFIETALNHSSVQGLILIEYPNDLGNLVDSLNLGLWNVTEHPDLKSLDISSNSNAKALLNIIAQKINEGTRRAIDTFHAKHPENTTPIIVVSTDSFTKEDMNGLHPRERGHIILAQLIEKAIRDRSGETMRQQVATAEYMQNNTHMLNPSLGNIYSIPMRSYSP